MQAEERVALAAMRPSIDTAVHMGANKSAEFERIIVESKVQEMPLPFPQTQSTSASSASIC